jgi:uncharacterized membrane protein
MWKAARKILLAVAATLPFAVADAAAPAPPLSVVGVAAGDVLNLRAEPDARSRIVARLAPNARDIVIVGQATQSLDWIMVQRGNARGWANARFLAYGDPQQRGRLPVRLRCAGTEPFWGIEVGYGRADANFAFDQRRRRINLAAPMPAAARPRIWLLPGSGLLDATSFLLVEQRVCSDGMSDRSYPYTVVARVGADVLSGCCL